MGEPKDIKILVVDDDPFILDMYVLKFKEQGFQIDTATDGKMALEKIDSGSPNIVLLDVVMPKMDGFDVIKKIQERGEPRTFKILFLTNFGQKEDVDRGMQLGADGYIIKAHFTPSEVVAKVKELLNIS
ncbi:MAG: response regulator transcription factor [bacterium]|nr:response regulator transcription factor [bacterium]MDZ4285729.1 response regulator transcription factor [Candidatus Sungbacteria bacterium]